MKHALGVAALACLFLSAPGCEKGRQERKTRPPAEPGRHYESHFSYMPPQGWQMRDFPGLKYKIAFAQASGGFAPNLNFVAESFSGSHDAYADHSIATLKRVFPKAQLRMRDSFTTDHGVEAVKICFDNQQQNKRLRQTAYLFGNGSRKVVATLSTLQLQGEHLTAAAEASLRTFRFE